MTNPTTEGRHLPVKSTVRLVRPPLGRLLWLRSYCGHQQDGAGSKVFPTGDLGENAMEYLVRGVKPYVPEAWIDEAYTDDRDGRDGLVGYEINLNRYFYEYESLRPLEEIEGEIREMEKEIVERLRAIAGAGDA